VQPVQAGVGKVSPKEMKAIWGPSAGGGTGPTTDSASKGPGSFLKNPILKRIAGVVLRTAGCRQKIVSRQAR
jgi:hypothetical protein